MANLSDNAQLKFYMQARNKTGQFNMEDMPKEPVAGKGGKIRRKKKKKTIKGMR